MKKTLLTLIIALLIIGLQSCTKDFNCKCTYIHHVTPFDSVPKADIVEENKVKARFTEQANVDCSFLEGKYFSNNFRGTCLIQ